MISLQPMRLFLLCALFVGCTRVDAAYHETQWSLISESLYSDNWIFAQEDEIDSAVQRIGLNANWLREDDLNRLRVTAYGDRRFFDSSRVPALSTFGGSVEYMRRKEYGGSVIEGSYSDRSALLSGLDQDGVPRIGDNDRNAAVRLREFRELSERSMLTVSLNWQAAQFDDDAVRNRRLDYDVLGFVGSYDYQWSETTTVSFGIAVDEITREGDVLTPVPTIFGVLLLPADQRIETLLYGPLVAIDAQLTPRWNLGVTASARRREDDFRLTSEFFFLADAKQLLGLLRRDQCCSRRRQR